MKDLSEKLEADGWKNWAVQSYETHNRTWFKFYHSKHLCRCNMDKRGIQMQVKEYSHSGYNSYNVCTSAELNNDNWPSFSMAFETMECLEIAVRLILAAWEAMNDALERMQD